MDAKAYQLAKQHANDYTNKKAENVSNIAMEHPTDGYPERPNANSVIWIGVNEPMDAEPFDEWRETKGFTFFTDFSEYTLGTKPDDWTEQWNDNSNTHEILLSANDEHYFAYAPGSSSLSSIAWDKLTPINTTDSEIYFKGRVTSQPQGALLSTIHRGTGTVGSETGYIIGLRGVSGGVNLEIGKKINGTSTKLTSTNLSLDATSLYHQRSRIDGDVLKVKIWQDSDPEPSEWTLETTDAEIIDDGFVGLYSYMSTSDGYVYDYGVGTGGMRAPRRKVLE